MPDKNMDTAACTHCNTRMELLHVKKYPGRWPAVLVMAGVFCCLFLIGALVGIPMLLLGIYMATAKETISRCPNCGHYFKVWMGEEGSV
ncbi:MAG: LITAF-like zinc ribbon domain-containing protein [Pseudomonadota bacterium]